ncbi:MAG: DUF3134 family protein [Cyanobacteriota bacterium]|nr:DUF3134 family protein [Cyanobacteriota bacterium]
MNNPSLTEERWDSPPTVVPAKDSLSIIDWLRRQGRLIEQAPDLTAAVTEEDIEDIDGLLDDDGYDDDFDSDDDD